MQADPGFLPAEPSDCGTSSGVEAMKPLLFRVGESAGQEGVLQMMEQKDGLWVARRGVWLVCLTRPSEAEEKYYRCPIFAYLREMALSGKRAVMLAFQHPFSISQMVRSVFWTWTCEALLVLKRQAPACAIEWKEGVSIASRTLITWRATSYFCLNNNLYSVALAAGLRG